MANKTISRYQVFYRKYGPRSNDGQYPVSDEIDKGTFEVPIWVNDPENRLKNLAGQPPAGYSFDFTWVGDS